MKYVLLAPILAVQIIWPRPAQAAHPHITGFAYGELRGATARPEPADPQDVFDLSGVSAETALIVDGRWSDATGRVRFTTQGRIDQSGWPQEKNVTLLELQITRHATDRLILSAGKRILSWDPGFAAQPLGFFQAETVLSDITDEAGRAAGLPLVSATWLGDSWSLSGVFSKDFGQTPDGGRRGLTQGAVRFTKQVGATDIALVLQKQQGAPIGFGGSLSMEMGDDLSFHASGFTGRQRYVHRPIFLTDPSQIATINDTSSTVRLDRARTELLAGFVFAPSKIPGMTFVGEYIHDGGGLSNAKWHGFVEQVNAQRAAIESGNVILARINLGLAGHALAVGRMRRDYSYMSATYEHSNWSVGQGALLGLADGSILSITQATLRPSSRLSISAAFQLFAGNKHSEFGILPLRSVAYLRLRRSF